MSEEADRKSRKTDIRYSKEANKYYRSVRKRFFDFSERLKLNSMKIDYNKLQEILSKQYNLEPDLKTLQGLFQIGKDDTKAINMVLVMAVCDIFNLSVSQYTKLEKNIGDEVSPQSSSVI